MAKSLHISMRLMREILQHQETTMCLIAEVLEDKPRVVETISPQTTAFEAAHIMVEKNVGSLLVVDEANCPIGIFTEHDYFHRVTATGKLPAMTFVRDVMSKDIVYTRSSDSIEECIRLMSSQDIRHIPVLDGEEIIGMVSMKDLVETLCFERGCEVKTLTDYITGTYPGEMSPRNL
jgi:CBS domain-containing protein